MTEQMPEKIGGLTQAGMESVRSLFESKKAEFSRALQNGIDPDYFVRVAVTAVAQNPQLLKCSQLSLYTAVLRAAQLSLNCDGLLGQAYLVPYGGKAELVVGYKGMRELALRTGQYRDIRARVVYTKDRFHVVLGTEETLEHLPHEGGRGAMRGAYAVAITKDGTAIFEFMWKEEIEKHRNQYSKSWKKADSMWQTAPERAWEKTVIRRLCNRLQMSVVAQATLNREDRMNAGEDLGGDESIVDIVSGGIDDTQPAEEADAGEGDKKERPGGVEGLATTLKNKTREGNISEPQKIKEVEEVSEKEINGSDHHDTSDFREVIADAAFSKFGMDCLKELRKFDRSYLKTGVFGNTGEPGIKTPKQLESVISRLSMEKLEVLWDYIKSR